jgi:hypothetical protein
MTPAAETLIAAALVVGAAYLLVRFELFCFRELAMSGDDELLFLTRTGWIVVIGLSIPVGGLLFLFRGRAR